MRVVKLILVALALTVALAGPGYAQATPPPKPTTPIQTAPKPAPQAPTTPPATAPAAQAPATLQPPAPFPQDAKYAVVDVQAIAQNSVAGKDASKKLNDLQAKKAADLQDKSKQLQALQTKRDTGGAVLSDTARAQLDKDIDKLQRDIQYAQSSAQAEMQDLNNELQGEFQKKLVPVIEEIAKEKGLYLVFTADSGFAYIHPGLNISDEVIKRLDAKKN
jgi:outer membrane protein